MMHNIFSKLKGFLPYSFSSASSGDGDYFCDGDCDVSSMWLDSGDDNGVGYGYRDGNGELLENHFGYGEGGFEDGDGDMFDDSLFFDKNEGYM